MFLSIKKTIEDQIEIETPSFYYDKALNRASYLNESEIVQVSDSQITVISKGDLLGTWYKEEAVKAAKLLKTEDWINKKVIRDKTSGQSWQEFGHNPDCLRYLLTVMFMEKYRKFLKG